jgi:hypothetical protein
VVGARSLGTGATETKGLLHHGDELGTGPGIPAREQGDVVAAPDEFVRQVRDDPFGASVADGRHRFPQRRDLSDLHYRKSPSDV